MTHVSVCRPAMLTDYEVSEQPQSVISLTEPGKKHRWPTLLWKSLAGKTKQCSALEILSQGLYEKTAQVQV